MVTDKYYYRITHLLKLSISSRYALMRHLVLPVYYPQSTIASTTTPSTLHLTEPPRLTPRYDHIKPTILRVSTPAAKDPR